MLKNTIFSDVFQDMNRFLNQAIEVLSSRPQSVDEIAEANQKHIEFGKSNKEVSFFLNEF